ncbi:hypothetical protein B0A49_04728 [Cryomyces minteri]|uniref:Uncharacterized protein n=1 Tax=Cryomyces minteri TaxID=331657 RepID=A0A4U0XAN5_9PEZI|nr:hypothetical protein B0A49_04728 [Cryomyces minteri]
MKSLTLALLAGAAAVANSQYVTNVNGTFSCPILNGAYCAGDSLVTNIIIRCNNGVGQPGNCNDNLSGEPPDGVNYAPCYQTSTTAGDAACSKNGTVYPASGAPFPVPVAGGSNSTTSASASVSASASASASGSASASASVYTNGTTTAPTTITIGTTTVSTASTVTLPIVTSTAVAGAGNATITPLSPKPSFTFVPYTGAAAANSVGALLLAVGAAIAVFA